MSYLTGEYKVVEFSQKERIVSEGNLLDRRVFMRNITDGFGSNPITQHEDGRPDRQDMAHITLTTFPINHATNPPPNILTSLNYNKHANTLQLLFLTSTFLF